MPQAYLVEPGFLDFVMTVESVWTEMLAGAQVRE